MSVARIGAVSYLNTKPLVYGLDVDDDRLAVEYDLPSRLADRLESGDLDVALIPVIEAVSNPTYTIVSDAAIACRGPVRSVKLVSRVAPEQIKTLALDEGSRTSVALSKIILAKRHQVFPKCQTLPIDADWRSVPTDAALIIGDRAMHPLVRTGDSSGFQFEWDLGEVWRHWTGLPFVFAVWACRPGNNYSELGHLLSHSRDRGSDALRAIAASQCGAYGLHVDECLSLSFLPASLLFGRRKKRLVSTSFFRWAGELNLLSPNRSLQFHDCKTVG